MVNVGIVVGRADVPTDGVLEYGRRLSNALSQRGHSVWLSSRTDVGLPWQRKGWVGPCPFEDVADVILLQYTNLGWSERGFPSRVLPLARRLRGPGRRLVVTVHDGPFFGSGLLAAGRSRFQGGVIRSLVRHADAGVFTTQYARKTQRFPLEAG